MPVSGDATVPVLVLLSTCPYRSDCLDAASAMRLHLAMRPPSSGDTLLALPIPFQPAQVTSASAAHKLEQLKHIITRHPALPVYKADW